MSAADMVIIVISGFFLVGMMVGVAAVYALSARKADRAHRRSRSEAARDANRRGKSGLPA